MSSIRSFILRRALLYIPLFSGVIVVTTESPALQGRDGFNSFQVFVFGGALLPLVVRGR